MYARSTTVRGDPRAVDEGIAYCRDAVWPLLRSMSGCVGMSMLADRDDGRCIVTAAWATDEAMRASAGSVQGLRARAAEVLGADEVDVEEWEIGLLHRARPTADGACARGVWGDIEPSRVADAIDTLRMTGLPRMAELPGFCSVSMLVDRPTGRTTMAVTYDSRDALVRSRHADAALRDELAAAMGVQVSEVAEFDLVLAHLHVPEMA